MNKSIVSVVKYEKPLESVRKAVELSKLFDDLPKEAKIFIKPNIVYWNSGPHPKWGVITTSRVMEDVVTLLKEQGIDDITIGEGFGSNEAAQDAFKKLGYNDLKERFGVKLINTNDRPYEKIDMGCDFLVNFASDPLKADYIISLPVLKTHSQAVVSLGTKNLKGFISIPSRKKFHSADPIKTLHFNVAKLPNNIPPCLTLIDGIYTLERGPSMDGKAHRTNLLIASKDILSADIVGAKLLGIEPSDVPHLIQAAKDRERSADLSDIEIVGEKIETVASHHDWEFIYNEAGDLPLPFYSRQFKGLKYRRYDTTMCTYCSMINGLMLVLLKNAWNGDTFGGIEFLTGKIMEPSIGMNKTILVGQCQYNKNKDHPNIKELVPIRGCPPSMDDIKNAFEICGIKVNPLMFQGDGTDAGGVIFLQKYKGKSEFQESFYKLK
ncbi:MAG: DUF362 domain-containing protein [Candidatus Lokiarchaeota archaeon]|nr:DUF362 domain-containing protein [Candidatus Lokiarchaeota archaeon]